MRKILLVEDDISYSRIIKNFLDKNGFEIVSKEKIAESISFLNTNQVNLIITDYRLPDGTGLDILNFSNSLSKPIPVILITNYSDIRIAVKAMKIGAVEYITKPINPDELLATVKETLSEDPRPRSMTSPETTKDDYIIGNIEASQKLEAYISLVAPTDLSVIVLGETGTGKEYISKKIHLLSNRNAGPFIAVDCGALSNELAGSELFGHIKGAFTGATDTRTGHFETAKGGTILLDEIGNLSYDIQIKLLRALQEKTIKKTGSNTEIPIDVRVIAATNEDLQIQVKEGEFREDLYHRLNEFSITALPLRERGEDLMIFAQNFLTQSNLKLGKNVKGFSPGVEKIFKKYPWPGNLRELKNIIRRSVLLCQAEFIDQDILPEELTRVSKIDHLLPDELEIKNSLNSHEKELIIKTLEKVKFNKTKAAKLLGIDRKTLYNKMEKYAIRPINS
ncbi:sigma-54-dependent transcriptional regulator [Aquiflexum lacus]|uniref:sigma-54-dependent transcriptional regulator n=1 Tax=Aquiflexum lacus TaxID=2483805 RepID=UPI00189508A5|nr:sigma-54 dependent transcriptional regulator [Aquiflexum lacus]